jgi:phage terminase small subunit
MGKHRVKKSEADPNWVETRGRKPLTAQTPLTRKQELFVKELVSKDGQITLREAAINAGYPASSAHSRAYELTNPDKCPHVVAAIRAYRAELDAKYGVTYQRHLRDLQLIRDMALQNGAYSAAVQAEYRRGQAQGDIYVSKSEIRHGSIDSMSKDEVLKALEEIKQSHAPITIDITPEEPDNSSNRAKARKRIVEDDEGRDFEELPETDDDEAGDVGDAGSS